MSESIINADRPNAGRIYDHLLGGHHNFEVDRQAAEQIVQLLPFLPKAARLQRWCLQDVALELTEKRGFNVIVDFASGLPTNDHFHHVVSPDTTIIYSDRDPVVVEYAREILKDVPNAHFFPADARHPEELLNRPEVEELLQGRRNVAIVCWGVSLWFTDEDIAGIAHALHDWAAPGSCWAFNAQGAVDAPDDPQVAQVSQIYARMGSPIYFRPLEDFQRLLQPWHVDDHGFVSLLDWHGIDPGTMTEEDRKIWSSTSGMYGAYLVK